jgi:hypothetical protein
MYYDVVSLHAYLKLEYSQKSVMSFSFGRRKREGWLAERISGRQEG